VSLHRAYAFLRVKAVDGDQRIITGIATTPTPDRMGDIVEPLGVTYKNPLPLLLYHNSQKPVGWVKFQKPTGDGIAFEAKLPQVDEPGTVRDRIEEAWVSIKTGLLAGVSIGFRSIEEAWNKETQGFHFLKTEVLELSLVAIPAQPDARIETIKNLDIGLAASGTEPGVARGHRPGASGTTRVVKARPDRPMKKSLADQIASFEATRQAKSARMDEILASAGDEGTTLDAAQKEEHDTLDREIKEIDEHLVRLHAAEERAKKAAVPVRGDSEDNGTRSRGNVGIVQVRDVLPQGIRFARYAGLVAASKGNLLQALEMAKMRWPDDSQMQAVLKAAVGAGTTSGSGWATELVPYNVLVSDFIEYLRPQTIIGQFGTGNIPSLRRVPFNIRVSGASAGTTGNWVGEGLPAPVSKMTTIAVTLTWAKVEGICVLTQEEVRFSSPSAEAKVRDDLARAIISRMDIDFVDPAKAAVANVSPASITNGVVAIAPTGTTAAKFRADLATLLGTFATNNLGVNDVVLIMSSSMALQLSMMVNTLGQNDFPEITMRGGMLRGFPVIVSEQLTALGSPSTQMIVAVKASEVYLADDGVVTVDASSEASLEMLDSALQQDGTAGTGASLVSLWQSGLLGLKAQREITWKLRRSTAVAYISPAAYVTQ
jgi:HK97 family phage major capsid protein/HK97 family phage prohead protease